MGYTSGFLTDRIQVLNRTAATVGDFGLDTNGPTWQITRLLWAKVEWQKGKSALREGAIDAYGVIMVRTRYTTDITKRSRIVYDDETYQILPETYHRDKRENTLQFLAQAIINEQ